MNLALQKNRDPRWAGATVVCIASGPSLTMEDIEVIRQQHAAGLCKTIVVNREFEFAPWADVLYMADWPCWQEYIKDVRKFFKGELWTVDQYAAKSLKLNYIARAWGHGYSRTQNTITSGSNSGFQAVHLAAYWGASRIVLLGYDMKRTYGKEHHYGKHRGHLKNGQGFTTWIQSFKPLVIDLKKMGVRLFNLTRETDLPEDWIPRSTVEAFTW